MVDLSSLVMWEQSSVNHFNSVKVRKQTVLKNN